MEIELDFSTVFASAVWRLFFKKMYFLSLTNTPVTIIAWQLPVINLKESMSLNSNLLNEKLGTTGKCYTEN